MKKTYQILKQLSLVLLLMLSVSCISTKTANTISKAEKKIALYNEGIDNQLERYPSLIDKAKTKIKYDTVFIYADSVKLKLLYQNISFLDSINKQKDKNFEEQLEYIDSLENIDYTKYDSSGKLRKTVINLTGQVKSLLRENKNLFEKYSQEITKRIDGEYTDSAFVVKYVFENGNLYLDVKTQPKYKVVPVSYTTNQIKATTRFWQDYRFYGFLLILFNIIYFFGSQLQSILKKIINAILVFVRKLIIKV